MSSNIEQGTKTLGQALGLAAQPVTPGFADQDQDQQTTARFAQGVGPESNIRGGSKQLGSASKIVKGPLVGPTTPVSNPLINPTMPSRDPLAGPTAPAVTSGKQPGSLIDVLKQLTDPRLAAKAASSTSKRQLADVSGIEDAGQSSAEKGLSV